MKKQSKKLFDVITIGSATRDVFLLSDDFVPVSDKKLSRYLDVLYFNVGSKNELKDAIISTGGGATNAAITFARQKMKVGAICRVGDTENGHSIVNNIAEEGVKKDFFQYDKKLPTAYSTILMTTKGDRVILVKRGASDHISFSDIPFTKLKTKWFYISTVSGNISLLRKIFAYAAKNNIKIAFNPGSGELKKGLRILKPLLKQVNLFIVNQEEAAELVDAPFAQEKKIFAMLDAIINDIVIMTKGADGVVVSDGKNIYHAGIPKSKVFDRTGAGDAFGSGFVAGLLCGEDIPFAIQLGTANSTSVIQHFSAKTGILHKGEWGKWSRVKVTKIRIKK